MTSHGPPEERLVYFPCGLASLAGILTVPSNPNGRTILIPWAAGAFPSSGRNRMRAYLARTLADQVFHAFRFDYLGVGESEGEYRKPDLAKPNTEEIVASAAWLATQGLSRIVVVAHCFGAWSSLVAAPRLLGLEGMALINAPVRRDHKQVRRSWRWWARRLRKLTLRKLSSAEHRSAYRKLVFSRASTLAGIRRRRTPHVSPENQPRFSDTITYLLERRIPVLLMYGDDDFRADFESELESGLTVAIEKADPPTRVLIVPEHLEGCATLGSQDALIKGFIPWLDELSMKRPTDLGRISS